MSKLIAQVFRLFRVVRLMRMIKVPFFFFFVSLGQHLSKRHLRSL